ncbi:MAG TPA: ubiquinone/menaquinone biosynthesis methyltransferase [Phycisphaerales bacterium]|nr:ubiquinone/menaquinone biosynthesis methyltransferase [Phycisphaerales bacterium]
MSATPPDPTLGPAPAAWTAADLHDPHGRADKADRVRSMFAAIARSYDLNNRIHSLWQDQAWRRSAVRAAGVRPGEDVLDCACGTGDLALAFALTPAATVTGLDFTPEMLNLARIKTESRFGEPSDSDPRVRYIQGDAQELPFADGSFDVVSIAFGIRNVQRPELALREFFRVLRPAGRLVILEFDRPRLAPVRWFNDFYCGWVMPRTATLISRDKSGAYRYLPRSVGTFMGSVALGDRLREVGFGAVEHKPLSLGICVRTLARKSPAGGSTSG